MAKLDWLTIEESGAFGDDAQIYVGVDQKDQDGNYLWFHTSRAELRRFLEELAPLVAIPIPA